MKLVAQPCRTPPPTIQNAFNDHNPLQVYQPGATVRYTCNRCYAGDSQISCLNTGRWTTPSPCRREILIIFYMFVCQQCVLTKLIVHVHALYMLCICFYSEFNARYIIFSRTNQAITSVLVAPAQPYLRTGAMAWIQP